MHFLCQILIPCNVLTIYRNYLKDIENQRLHRSKTKNYITESANKSQKLKECHATHSNKYGIHILSKMSENS